MSLLGQKPNSKEILEKIPASSGYFFARGFYMVKMHSIKLSEYENKDPRWWCQHHKSTVAHLALRLEQVLDGRDDLEEICRNLIRTIKRTNEIDWEYYDEEL